MAQVEEVKLKLFLEKIQLEHFYKKLNEDLHVRRTEHLEHVIESDLVDIGMSLPEIRRLFDHYKRNNKRNFFSKLKKTLGLSSENVNIIHQTPSVVNKQKPVSEEKTLLKCVINKDDIILKELLGNGAFGYVHSADWLVEQHQVVHVAVKSLQVTESREIAQMHSDLVMEANAMIALNHPNLIRLYGVILTSPMMLVTELAPLGSLLKKLREEPEQFHVASLCSFVVQIVAGMKYLEKHRFVHRDLAARNCLLMTYEKVKIGDFGLSRPIREDMEYYVMQPDGRIPFAWCAPECLNFRKFSHASDMWAFGVTAVEIFTYGAQPWAGLNGGEILQKIDEPNCERPPRPKHFPRAMYNIISNFCWAHKAEDRKTFVQLERALLDELPYELTADFTNLGSTTRLAFQAGDTITIFDESNGTVICQNRSSRKVGQLPKEIVNLLGRSGTISDDEKTLEQGRKYYDCDGELTTKKEAPLSPNDEGYYEHMKGRSVRYSGLPYKSLGSYSDQGSCSTDAFDDLVFESQYDGYESERTWSSSQGTASYNISQSSCDSGCRCSLYSSDSSCHYIDIPISSVEDHTSELSRPIDIPSHKNYRTRLKQASHSKSSPNSLYTNSSLDSEQSFYQVPSSAKSIKEGTILLDKSRQSASNVETLPNAQPKSFPLDCSSLPCSNPLLPDIVNPNTSSEIFQRRRSLPQNKRRSVTNFENKLFADDTNSSNIFSSSSLLRECFDVLGQSPDYGNMLGTATLKVSDRPSSLPSCQCSAESASKKEHAASLPNHYSKSSILYGNFEVFDLSDKKLKYDKVEAIYDTVPLRNSKAFDGIINRNFARNKDFPENTKSSTADFKTTSRLSEVISSNLCAGQNKSLYVTNSNIIQGQDSATFVSETNADSTDDINATISPIASSNARKTFNEYKGNMSYLGDSYFGDALLSSITDYVSTLTCEPVTPCLPSATTGSPEVIVKHFTTTRKISGNAKSNCDKENRYLDSDSRKLDSGAAEPIKDDSAKVSVFEIQDDKRQSKDGSKSEKYDCEPIVPPRINRKKSVRHKKCIVLDPNSV